jgi:hypothetical protein
MSSVQHETRPIQVWIDADVGIADLVLYLNTIPGVRTHNSCQGSIGEGGPYPYRAYVMCSWTPEAFEQLSREFDISYPENCNKEWGCVHPREGWKAPVPRREGKHPLAFVQEKGLLAEALGIAREDPAALEIERMVERGLTEKWNLRQLIQAVSELDISDELWANFLYTYGFWDGQRRL